MPPAAEVVMDMMGPPGAHRSGERKKKKKEPAPLALWFAGGPVNQKASLKYGKELESGPSRVKSSSGENQRPASIVEILPSAENGKPLRQSAPNGKPVKGGWL